MIGGSGPRRTIPLAARWADQWNYPDFTSEPDLFVPALRRFEEACEEIGRPLRDRGLSPVPVPGRPGRDSRPRRGLQGAGADHVLVSFMPPTSIDLPPDRREAGRSMT